MSYFVTFHTVEVPPEPSLSVASITATSVRLEWTQITIQPVTRFYMRWTYTGPCDPLPSQSVLIDGGDRSFTVSGLEEGGNYTFGLTAINGVGTGPENTTIGQTLLAGSFALCVS